MLTQKIMERAHVYTACPLFVWKLGYNQLTEVRSVSQATHFGLLSTLVLYTLFALTHLTVSMYCWILYIKVYLIDIYIFMEKQNLFFHSNK